VLLGSIPVPIAGKPPSSPSSLLRAPQLHTGAPCSHQRTWAENDGRSPSTVFSSGLYRLFIGSVVEKSAVQRSFLGNVFRQSNHGPAAHPR
jgi:hypothetical protein